MYGQIGRADSSAGFRREDYLEPAEFVDDMQVPGMLHGAVLRSKYPRALVKRIDISAAQSSPGVVAVLTAKDVPGERLIGHIVHDWPVMIAEGEETRYVGDALVILAAETRRGGSKALNLIRVEYEEACSALSPQAALADGAPRIHPKGNLLSQTIMKRGDVDKAIAEARYVVNDGTQRRDRNTHFWSRKVHWRFRGRMAH